MDSLIVMVCAECGRSLRDLTVPVGIEVKMAVQVPQCDICRTRAVNAAFMEGQESMKEMIE
jgi:hypothetical protein